MQWEVNFLVLSGVYVIHCLVGRRFQKVTVGEEWEVTKSEQAAHVINMWISSLCAALQAQQAEEAPQCMLQLQPAALSLHSAAARRD